jgi:hypothetical protein
MREHPARVSLVFDLVRWIERRGPALEETGILAS